MTRIRVWNQIQIYPSSDSAVLTLGAWRNCLRVGLACFPRLTIKPSPQFQKKSKYISTTARSAATDSSTYLYFVWCKSPAKIRTSELSTIQTSQRNSLCLEEDTVLTEGIPEIVGGKQKWEVICPVPFQRMSGGPQATLSPVVCTLSS